MYKVGEKGFSDGQLRDLRGMVIDGKDNFIVCDSGNYCFYMFIIDGRVFVFGIQGKVMGQFDKL